MIKYRLSRTSVTIIIICAFLFIVNVSLGLALTKQSSQVMRSLIESRMLDVSNTAAALLDGDTLETLTAEDRDTPQYQAVYKMLSCFEENIGLEYIYCVRETDDGSFIFVIDPDPVSPAEFGDHIVVTDALIQASLGIPAVDKEAYADQWGRFYSAFSPVFNSEHEVGGIVAVDFSADWYEQQVSNQVRTTLLITFFSLLIASVIIIILGARYSQRFGDLFQEMNLVSESIETLVMETSPGAQLSAWKEDTPHQRDQITELGMKVHSLQDKLSEQIAYVRSQAYIDALTGLSNRTAYEEDTKRLDDEIKAGNAAFSLALFDINGLKRINDGFGHAKGDEVIVAAASDLREAFESAKIYRIGGDEFVVIVEGADNDIQAQVRQLLAKESPVSMSHGCAVYDAETDAGYHMVFSRADNAMYDDKRAYYLTHEKGKSS